MKYQTKPFDIEEARTLEEKQPGEYIKTTNGESVEVLTFDRSEDLPIVALVGVKKTIVCYDRYGQEVSGRASVHDLVLRTDEPAPGEVSTAELHQRFCNEVQTLVDTSVDLGRKDLADKWTQRLLDIARDIASRIDN